MPPGAVVGPEVSPAGLGRVEADASILQNSRTVNLVRVTLWLALDVGLDILTGLVDITGNIKGVARSLGDGQTEVESNASWNGTEADDDTPHLVNSKSTDTVAGRHSLGRQQGLLETSGDDKSDDGCSELANTLHGEDRAHHGTTPFGSSESVSS